LDGPFPKLCPAVALSHQDGRHSAVTLLLKAALIQVSLWFLFLNVYPQEPKMRNLAFKLKKYLPRDF
jgi:hypothetical protein